MKAVIQEDACIGCAKCLAVCPTDAIIGALKHLHTIIENACTGCGWCLPPCPVDCIELVEIKNPLPKEAQSKLWRKRYSERKKRLSNQNNEAPLQTLSKSVEERKTAIQEAVLRVAAKRKLNEPKNL